MACLHERFPRYCKQGAVQLQPEDNVVNKQYSSCRDSSQEDASAQRDSDVVGTVMVRDVVSRAVVAHFRAHTAPLLVLQWDASGTLLVTASVHGHNVNVFQVSMLYPVPPGRVCDRQTLPAVLCYRLAAL